MKRVLMVAAAMTAAVSLADVESANVVGYMSVSNNTGCTYNGFGAMFVTPGKTTYRLYDLSLSAAGANINYNIWKNQTIAFLQPGSMKTDLSKTFYYEPDDKKWYYKSTVKDSSGEVICTAGQVAPDMEFPAGVGFLTTFGRSVKVTYAGQIIAQSGVKPEILKPASGTGVATTYFFASNPHPTPIHLYDIKLAAASGSINYNIWKNQTIAFMQTAAMKTDLTKTFYYEPDDDKWYYKSTVKDAKTQEVICQAGQQAPNIEIPAGASFLCTFGRDVKIIFPAINY